MTHQDPPGVLVGREGQGSAGPWYRLAEEEEGLGLAAVAVGGMGFLAASTVRTDVCQHS